MPKKLEKKRGGVLRYRTIDLPNGDYIHIAVVRKKGPYGGKTIVGPVHHKKRKRR